MLQSLLADLLRLEAVNTRAIAGGGWPGMWELQCEAGACLAPCREFAGLAEWDPTEVEPMTTRSLLARKHQALALVNSLAEAMRPQGSPLHADLRRLRAALGHQIARLESQLDPRPAGDWWLAEGYRLEKAGTPPRSPD